MKNARKLHENCTKIVRKMYLARFSHTFSALSAQFPYTFRTNKIVRKVYGKCAKSAIWALLDTIHTQIIHFWNTFRTLFGMRTTFRFHLVIWSPAPVVTATSFFTATSGRGTSALQKWGGGGAALQINYWADTLFRMYENIYVSRWPKTRKSVTEIKACDIKPASLWLNEARI